MVIHPLGVDIFQSGLEKNPVVINLTDIGVVV